MTPTDWRCLRHPLAPRGGEAAGHRRAVHAALTDPDGFLASNSVLSSLFARLPPSIMPL